MAETLVFQHRGPDTAELLRVLARYVEASGATLLSVVYTNDDGEAGFSERLTATLECAWVQ